MKNKYPVILLQLIAVLTIVVSSCKKDSTPAPAVVNAKPVTIGLFEYAASSNNTTIKRVFIPISKIGTQTVNYDLIFDTGSTGFTIGASGIVPDADVTNTGFNIAAGDSLVLKNGIVITSHASTMSYGNATSSTTEYGNLAYASITIPDEAGKGVTIKRVPMFLYYKIEQTVNNVTTKLGAHAGDIFGVGPGVSYTNSSIGSPLSYYSPGTSLTKGFKLSQFVSTDFVTDTGNYVENLLTLGLTSADLNSSGFIMHPLSIIDQSGYSPNIPGTITYNGNTISAQLLFDTGTPSITIIEKPASIPPLLPKNTVVTVTTNKGFTYTYTTTDTNNLTQVQNPNNTGDLRSIFSINFFVDNEFLTDYAGHQIGLKNN